MVMVEVTVMESVSVQYPAPETVTFLKLLPREVMVWPAPAPVKVTVEILVKDPPVLIQLEPTPISLLLAFKVPAKMERDSLTVKEVPTTLKLPGPFKRRFL